MKALHFLFAATTILLISSFNGAGVDEKVTVFSKILEIEAVQEVLRQNDHTVVTNGMIDSNVKAYLDEVPINMEADTSNPGMQLSIQKYRLTNNTAKILITKPNTKVKVKLQKDEGEWKVNSYYIKNGKSLTVSVSF